MISGVILVGCDLNLQALRSSGAQVVRGGASRQESSLRALEAAPEDCDALVIHDAARPFASAHLITRVVEAIERSGAAAAAIPVVDTIKRIQPSVIETLDRSSLVAMQTPQGATVELLRKAHRSSQGGAQDDMALIEALGVHPEFVPGEPLNFKITTPDDLTRARAILGNPETRSGFGYDIHPFSSDNSRVLSLGGVAFPGHPALDGHSDADVLLHAVTDAVLGAAALGDIGQHFPNDDPRWHGEPSLTFLRHAAKLVQEAGWRIVNLDMTLVAESPKIMKRAEEIRRAVGEAVGVDPSRVSVKATTNEGLGSIGRSEGIAAFATATLVEVF